jgi:hypothetical protein
MLCLVEAGAGAQEASRIHAARAISGEIPMTNDEHRQLITNVNGALKWPLPVSIRSISADLSSGTLTLQYVHDGMPGKAEKQEISRIEKRVASAMTNCHVKSTLIRVDAPNVYADQLLPVVVLAMFEQEE